MCVLNNPQIICFSFFPACALRQCFQCLYIYVLYFEGAKTTAPTVLYNYFLNFACTYVMSRKYESAKLELSD